MKKYLVFVLAIFVLLCAFTACKSDEATVTDPVTDPAETVAGEVRPVEKETIDWETPIDVDDSFIEDPTEPGDTPVEPSDETGPMTTVDPTNPTDSSEQPTETPDVTEAPTDSETQPPKNPGSSGAIELPMIPG